jgi:hypothetical protein
MLPHFVAWRVALTRHATAFGGARAAYHTRTILGVGTEGNV